MAIFLGVSAAPEHILISKISYAPVQHSSLHQKVLLWIPSPLHSQCYQSLFNRMTELTQTCGDCAAEGLEVSGGP